MDFLNFLSTETIHCYNCTNYEGFKREDTCEYKLALNKSVHCPEMSLYCLKIIGYVDGMPSEVRSCAEVNWRIAMGGTDKCSSASSIKSFKFRIPGEWGLKLTSGTVCICDTNECNAANSLGPAIKLFAFTAIIGMI